MPRFFAASTVMWCFALGLLMGAWGRAPRALVPHRPGACAAASAQAATASVHRLRVRTFRGELFGNTAVLSPARRKRRNCLEISVNCDRVAVIEIGIDQTLTETCISTGDSVTMAASPRSMPLDPAPHAPH
jgi:hypothetical protein